MNYFGPAIASSLVMVKALPQGLFEHGGLNEMAKQGLISL
jgi:hypothetical protein